MTGNAVTRCPVCGRQRQQCAKCSGAGLVPDAHGVLGTCSDCLGTGHAWINPAFGAEFVKDHGVQVEWDRCPDCEGKP